MANPGTPLGTLVFRAGLVPADRLEDALEESVRRGRRLGEILLERGLIEEADLARIIAGQKDLPFLEREELQAEPEAVCLLSEEKARLYRALPVRLEDGVPLVAITDPTNDLVLREITLALGVERRFAVASRRDLMEALASAYGRAMEANGRHASVEELYMLEPELACGPDAPPEAIRSDNGRFRHTGLPGRSFVPAETGRALLVVVRLSNGEHVEVASASDQLAAQERARAFIRELAGREPEDWPYVGGRFLRPDSIMSVDILNDRPAGGADRT